MVADRPETKNNVIDFVKAKQKLEKIKSSTNVLNEEFIEEEDVFFEIIYDHDNDDN